MTDKDLKEVLTLNGENAAAGNRLLFKDHYMKYISKLKKQTTKDTFVNMCTERNMFIRKY